MGRSKCTRTTKGGGCYNKTMKQRKKYEYRTRVKEQFCMWDPVVHACSKGEERLAKKKTNNGSGEGGGDHKESISIFSRH